MVPSDHSFLADDMGIKWQTAFPEYGGQTACRYEA